MIIDCFPIKKSVDEARQEAGKRGFIARLLSWCRSDREITMRTIYIENRLITFDITTMPPFFAHLFGKSAIPGKSKIEMIANGSTMGISYYDRRGVEIVQRSVDDEDVQFSDYDDDKLILRANVLARRILRRRVGGRMQLNVAEIRSVFRPYHVAFFGKPTEGEKIYYIPIAADGCVIARTF